MTDAHRLSKRWSKKWSVSSQRMRWLPKCNTVRSFPIYALFNITDMIPDVLENVNPDLSDSEFMPKDELEQPEDMGTPLPLGSEAGDAPTPMGGYGDANPSDEEGSEGSSGDIDEELAAELNQALGGDSESSSGDSEGGGGSDDDNDGRGSDEDEDEEDEFDHAEDKRAKKLLNEEIRDLEAAVEKKSTEIEQSMNPLIRVCYSFFPELREDR
jgi:transcription initiation factor TFIID subunit 7